MKGSKPTRARARDSQLWNCENAFEYKCPRAWESLATTESQSVRFCNECRQNVYLCESPEEFVRHGEQGHCVAVPIEVVPGSIQRSAGMPSREVVREQERLTRKSASFWEAVILQEPAFCPEGIEELRKELEILRRLLEFMDEATSSAAAPRITRVSFADAASSGATATSKARSTSPVRPCSRP